MLTETPTEDLRLSIQVADEWVLFTLKTVTSERGYFDVVETLAAITRNEFAELDGSFGDFHDFVSQLLVPAKLAVSEEALNSISASLYHGVSVTELLPVEDLPVEDVDQ